VETDALVADGVAAADPAGRDTAAVHWRVVPSQRACGRPSGGAKAEDEDENEDEEDGMCESKYLRMATAGIRPGVKWLFVWGKNLAATRVSGLNAA